MGLAAYFLSNERNARSSDVLKLYWIQLVLNALWPFVFWRIKAFVLAAMIIVMILTLVIIVLIKSLKINKLSAYLFIPYIIWLLFALYLNIGVAILN